MGHPSLAGVEAGARGAWGQRAFVCLLAASLWALPRALHAWGAAEGGAAPELAGLGGYLALVGCGLLSLVLVGLSWGTHGEADREASWSLALTWGFGLALGPWAALAYWLAVATHHRPLGGVTYAAGALLIGLVSVALARWVSRRGAMRRAAAPLAWGVLSIGLGGLVAVAVQQPALRATLPDAALGALLAIAVAVMPSRRGWERVERWGVPICVGVWVVTVGLLASSPDVRATVKSAPIIAGAAGLVLP